MVIKYVVNSNSCSDYTEINAQLQNSDNFNTKILVSFNYKTKIKFQVNLKYQMGVKKEVCKGITDSILIYSMTARLLILKKKKFEKLDWM